MSRPTDPVRYPIAPLLALMSGTPREALARLKVSGSTQQEYLTRGVSELVADRLAIRAGLHPYVVWPEMVDAVEVTGPTTLEEEQQVECASPRCSTRFVPSRKGHVYCRPRCGANVRQAPWQKERYWSNPDHKEKRKADSRAYYADTAAYQRARKAAYRDAKRVAA
jgi:hypothetical protein